MADSEGSYKLVYFAVRGRGQALKYLAVDNDLDIKEDIVEMVDWDKVKPTTPFGQLPVFYDGTFELAQSNAILRYLARKHCLYGADDQEAATIDMLNDQQEDLRLGFLSVMYLKPETRAWPEEEKAASLTALPEKLNVFEKWLSKNQEGVGYFVGSKASFLDYNMFDVLDNHLLLSSTCLDALPLLKGYHKRISEGEKISAYRQTEAFKLNPVRAPGHWAEEGSKLVPIKNVS